MTKKLSDSPTKSRGPTKLLNQKNLGTKKVVQFNSKGVPYGDEAKSLMSTLGVLARTTVPITYSDWRKVPDHLKEKMWEYVQDAFEIDHRMKKSILQSIGNKFRTFKNILTTKYIMPFVDNLDAIARPPSIYSFISQNDWERFVKSRLSENFKKLSEEQKKRQKHSKYPHRLSRGGYATLEHKLKAELKVEGEIDRSELWKQARQDKEGHYAPETMPIIEKIDELMEQSKAGTITFSGSDDILSKALGTNEHRGRVRGVGKFITPLVFFSTPNKVAYLEARLAEVEQKLLLLTQGSTDSHSPVVQLEGHSSNKIQKLDSPMPMKDSCDAFDEDLKMKGVVCKLAVDTLENVVAMGTIVDGSSANFVVSVDQIFSQDARLPIENEDEYLIFVKDALGHHVSWPKDLVSTHIVMEV